VKHKSVDLKLVAIRHYLETQNQLQTCRVFECSARSLMRWVKRYNDASSLERQNRKPVAYTVTKEHVAFITGLVKKNPEITASEVLTTFKTKFPTILLSRVHIGPIIYKT